MPRRGGRRAGRPGGRARGSRSLSSKRAASLPCEHERSDRQAKRRAGRASAAAQSQFRGGAPGRTRGPARRRGTGGHARPCTQAAARTDAISPEVFGSAERVRVQVTDRGTGSSLLLRRGRASCASTAGACSWSGISPTAGEPSAASWADSSGGCELRLSGALVSRARPRGACSADRRRRPRGRLSMHGHRLGRQLGR